MKYLVVHSLRTLLLKVILLASFGVWHSIEVSLSKIPMAEAQLSLSAKSTEIDSLRCEILRTIARGDSLYDAQSTYDTQSLAQSDSLYNAALIAALSIDDSKYVLDDTLKVRCLDASLSVNFFGLQLFKQGDYGGAKIRFERTLAIREKFLGSEHPDVAESLNLLGVALEGQGDYDGARNLMERALSIRERVYGADHIQAAEILNDLAELLFNQGEYEGAKHLWEKSLAIHEKELKPGHMYIAVTLCNLADLLCVQGDYEKAKTYYERALMIMERAFGPEHPKLGPYLNSLATLFGEQGDFERAKPLVERSLANFEKVYGWDHPGVATALDILAKLLLHMGDYENAKRYYEQALAIREEMLGPDHPDVAFTLMGLADLTCDQGNFEGAKPFIERALAIRKHVLGSEHPLVTDCQEALSRLALLQNDPETCWKECSRTYLARRRELDRIYAISSERQALLYTERARVSLDLLVSTANILGRTDAPDSVRAFVVSALLQSKGQVLDEISVRYRLSRRGDPQTTALEDSLKAARLRIADLYVKGPKEENPEVYFSKLKAAFSDKEKWELELAAKSAAFRAEQIERNATASSVAACLPDGAVLVDFFRYAHFPARPGEVPARAEKRDLACVLKADDAASPALVYLGPSSVTDSLITAYRQHFDELVMRGALPDSDDEEEFREIAGALYQRIWRPIERELGEAKLVFVSPDASLNLVCFGGLPAPDGGYLIERYPIHYLSSGRDLIRLKADYTPGKGLLAFGDPDFDAPAPARVKESFRESVEVLSRPSFALRNVRSSCGRLDEIEVDRLPASGREVREIKKIFAEKTREPVSVCLEMEASEDRLKTEADGKRMIHLATHAYYLQGKCPNAGEHKITRSLLGEDKIIGESPLLLSGLFLAGSNLHGEGAEERNMDDGILTAEEICSLNLVGTEWIVLSACETGLGELKKGEGVFGLRRAFQLAEARTVIMSLWPVGDRPTREYMLELYGHRLNGSTTVDAMREASLVQLEKLRKRNRATHPFTWGAFVAVGDWR